VCSGFPKRSCSNKRIERDDDSKKSHHALVRTPASNAERNAIAGAVGLAVQFRTQKRASIVCADQSKVFSNLCR
jgi:hypothetical protein